MLQQLQMGCQWKPSGIDRDTRDWVLGLVYIVAVAAIWIAASYLVQSVVDAGVSPFLLSYICSSLFLVYIPIVEVARCCEDLIGKVWFWHANQNDKKEKQSGHPENVSLLQESTGNIDEHYRDEYSSVCVSSDQDVERTSSLLVDAYAQPGRQSDQRSRWTRSQVAKVSLLICPFWFLAQFTFNVSLKYTTVTVSILSRHSYTHTHIHTHLGTCGRIRARIFPTQTQSHDIQIQDLLVEVDLHCLK